MRRCCWLAPVLCFVLLGRLAAQTAPESPQPRTSDAPKALGPPVEASQLDTFLLRDSKGNLVPVLGMSFEEFEELLRIKKSLAPPAPPHYTLDSVSVVGIAEQGVAKLQVAATIRVRQDGWVRVPILMPTAIVKGELKHEGPGEHFLTFDAAAGGYVCWLRGPDGGRHVVTLSAAVALGTLGEWTRLAVTIPRATESSLRLMLPFANSETLLTGEGLLTTRAADGGQSEVSVLGPAGELELKWRRGPATAAKGPPQLDATGGEIQVRVESQQSITSSARLRVRSLAGALETFQVRLPPGMELQPQSPVGYTLAPLETSSGPAPPRRAAGQVVEVRLERPTTGITEVQIATALQPDANLAAWTPARFEVLGAVRQRGTIDFSVGGQWQLEWIEDRSVRRVDLAAETAPDQVARFEYFRQPCGLQLRVAARPARVSVEPTHLISVDAQLVRIKSTFKYKFRGSRTAGLLFELGDWNFDSLTPSDLLETPIVKGDAAGQVQVPFRQDKALPTELEITLEAHRTLAATVEQLDLPVPRALADVVAPATVVVSPADNIELTPQPEMLVGLSPDPSGVRIPGRQQPPLVYRDLGGGEPAAFAARRQIRTRFSTVAARATLRLDRQQMQVQQRLDYRIAHEPQRTFTLLVPRGLPTSGNLQVMLDGSPLSVSLLPDAGASSGAAQRLEFTTPEGLIGVCQVDVRYTVPLSAWDGEKQLKIGVPLPIPADERQQFAGQQLDFQFAEGWQIEPDEQAGSDEFSRRAALPAAAGVQAFTWSKATTISRWIVHPPPAAQQTAIVLSKAWIQTWLAPRVRQERAAYRLKTAQESLRVQLPHGSLVGGVQAALNGHPTMPLNVRETNQVHIDLPPAMRGRECTLELWYSLQTEDHPLGIAASRLRPAQIDGAGQPRRTYWQLALPTNEHLLAGPTDLAAEMAWSPRAWWWTREPLLDQPRLEEWIHASRQDPLPRGMQVYLFGGLGRAATFEAWTIHRRLLLALASGGALALGLALLHWPVLRRPSALLVLAVGLAGAALAAPDLAVLVGQGAALGLLVVLAVALWNWLSFGRAPWPQPGSASTSRPRESLSTQPPSLRPDHGAPITAATGAAALEVRP